MGVKIAVLRETESNERRVAMTPAVAEKLAKLGVEIVVEAGAGAAVNIADHMYVGATIVDGSAELVRDADIVVAVQAPAAGIAGAMQQGAVLISFVYAAKEPELVATLVQRGVTCFAMELIPRITRAQSMDALSSQAALAGYYGALLGATHLSRILPMMSTAAGAIRPAQVLVMGLGVAGLQAIATSRRLGAVVEGYDVRPETREQALSLGAKFVDTGIDARGEGGYARELTADEKDKVDQALTAHIQRADIIITTAAIPGRPSPKLITAQQVRGMKPGSVIIDLAAEGGGNCESSVPGDTIAVGPATIVAPLNVPSMVGENASDLYAKNIYNLLELILHDGAVEIDWSDEILAKTVLTHAGAIKNEVARAALARLQAA